MYQIILRIVAVLVTFLVLFQSTILSQKYSSEELDSLIQVASVCDSAGVKAMGDIAGYYYGISNRSMHGHYVHREVECAEALNHHNAKDRAYYHLLIYNLYKTTPDTDSMLIASEKMLNFCKTDTSIQARRYEVITHYIVGNHFFDNVGDVDLGYKYYQEALRAASRNKQYDNILFVASGIFHWLEDEGEFEKAYAFSDSILNIIPDPGLPQNDVHFQNVNKINLKNSLDELRYKNFNVRLNLPNPTDDEYEKVKILGNQLIQKDLNNNFQFNAAVKIRNLCTTLENYLPLDSLLNLSSFGISLEQNFEKKNAEMYYYHAKFLNKKDRYKKAKSHLIQAIEIAKQKEKQYDVIANCYNELTFANLKLGERNAAAKSFDQFKLYIDSAYTRKNKTAVEAVETKYELNLQRSENQLLESEALVLNNQLKQTTFFGGLLLALLSFAIFSYLQKRKSESKLKELNRTKDKVFAILAHDLRNPISALGNLSEKVKFLAKNNRLDELDAMASQTDSKLQALNENLNNVLLWAIKESNLIIVKSESISLHDEVQKICDIYSEDIGLKNIFIKNDITKDLMVKSDIKVVQTIIRNLVSNAIKFSYPQGTIQFHVEESQNKTIVKITDNGIGINNIEIEKDREKLAIRKKSKGSGIGLNICQELATKSGIILKLTPNDQGGTIGILEFDKAA